MGPDLTDRIVKALQQAARDARSYDQQVEIAAVLAELVPPPAAPAETAPEPEPEHATKARKR